MNPIDNIMTLHDEAAEARHVNGSPLYNAVADQKRQVLRDAIALTPGDPVAWMHTGGHVHVRNPQWPPKTAALYTAEKGWTPLYTAPPPQREWAGLTDGEIDRLMNEFFYLGMEPTGAHYGNFARAIEVKLREKNGGGV